MMFMLPKGYFARRGPIWGTASDRWRRILRMHWVALWGDSALAAILITHLCWWLCGCRLLPILIFSLLLICRFQFLLRFILFHSREYFSILLTMIEVQVCAQISRWLEEEQTITLDWAYWAPEDGLPGGLSVWGGSILAAAHTLVCCKGCLLLLGHESFDHYLWVLFEVASDKEGAKSGLYSYSSNLLFETHRYLTIMMFNGWAMRSWA